MERDIQSGFQAESSVGGPQGVILLSRQPHLLIRFFSGEPSPSIQLLAKGAGTLGMPLYLDDFLLPYEPTGSLRATAEILFWVLPLSDTRSRVTGGRIFLVMASWL